MLLALPHIISQKISFVVMGVEGTRTDTIMAVFISTGNKKIDVISIPRDCYHPVAGYDGLGQRKINAVYGFSKKSRADRVKNAVGDLLGRKIDHFVVLDYESVPKIVDLVGGVDIQIDMPMKYKDPYSKPPLVVDFDPGLNRIGAGNVLAYLRFRQSSDGSYSGGDLGRIERQQLFFKKLAKKMIGIKLPIYAARALDITETSISAPAAIWLGMQLIGSKVNLHTLPENYVGYGDDGLSYFFHDEKKTAEMMDDIAPKKK